ncbi:Bifunctional dehydrogenase and ferrochelatase [Scheffersomyces spartinae]|uniref:precorrin-2 dehydrogenase n=1 Tax=Scheffersomyces spartinae TaxID=45513 RepID=A0A9P7V8X3_9ASCO|nr:Bifunctional dehydrogenase and ferrochelatase [Scheffersomyces spartinae]KAG7193220.1 Bifunctional dehydrogenase and ferrochelatase [Scheffersomyces spartinae]
MSHLGSLCLAWQVKDKHCLVIGGGEVALSRVQHLLYAQAKITIITGEGNIHPGIVKLNNEGKIFNFLQRNYQPNDLVMYETGTITETLDHQLISQFVHDQMIAIVCCCIDDYELSTKIYYQCKVKRLPVNIADKPPLCDFYFGSMFNQDNLQIMISTNGKSPRLLKIVKDTIARNFEGIDINKAVENLGKIRLGLRSKVIQDDDLASIEIRMKWIKDLTDMFTVGQWSQLDLKDENVSNILQWFPDFPPSNYTEFVASI